MEAFAAAVVAVAVAVDYAADTLDADAVGTVALTSTLR